MQFYTEKHDTIAEKIGLAIAVALTPVVWFAIWYLLG